MFVVVEHPIVDVRSMLSIGTGRTRAPDWRWLPDHNDDFVKGLGPVRPRRLRGIEPWPCEGYYVDCRSGLRFESVTQRDEVLGVEYIPVLRRFFSDGIVGRLEVGLRTSRRLSSYSGIEPEAVALSILGLRARLPGHQGQALSAIGPAMASFLLRATTSVQAHRRPTTVSPWWTTANSPLVLCELGLDEVTERPDQPPDPVGAQLRSQGPFSVYVEQRWKTVGRVRASFWFIVFDPQTSRDTMRRVRIHISRLHSEHEAFRRVLRLADRGQLDVVNVEDVRSFINDLKGPFTHPAT